MRHGLITTGLNHTQHKFVNSFSQSDNGDDPPKKKGDKTKDREVKDIFLYRKDIDLFADDKYGHWWIEINNNESYGWWPSKPVGIMDTIFGVPGELNGQTEFGGKPTLDPHHGDKKGVRQIKVYSEDNRSKNEIIKQIRDFSKKYSGN